MRADPPVPVALDALLREALETHAKMHMLYCHWCFRDVNGVDGEPDLHADDCWLVRVEAALRAAGPRHREFAAKLFNIVLGDLEWVRAQGGRHSVCPLCHCVCERDGGPGHADDCPRIEIAQEFNALYPSSPGAAGPGRTPIEGAEAAAVAPVPSQPKEEKDLTRVDPQ